MVSPDPRQMWSSARMYTTRPLAVNVRRYSPEAEKTRSSCDVPFATTISPRGILRMPVTPLNCVCVFDSLPISSVGRGESVQGGTLGCGSSRHPAAPIARRRRRLILRSTRVLRLLLVPQQADDAVLEPRMLPFEH